MGKTQHWRHVIQGSWLHLKAFTEHSSEYGNIGTGHTHLRNEGLQPTKQSNNGTQSQE